MVSQKPNDQFRTPEVLFQRYNERYAFTVDGAANEQDTLCSTWWGPGGGHCMAVMGSRIFSRHMKGIGWTTESGSTLPTA